MLLTHCMMGWTVLVVLSLCLPMWTAQNVIQPYRVESINGTAQVRCIIQRSQNENPPYTNLENYRVTLLKGLHGTQQICSSALSFTEYGEKGAECSTEMMEGAAVVTVSGLKATDTDMYRCEIEVFYPPPYLKLIGNGTLIHVLESADCPVQGAQKEGAHRGDDAEDDEGGDTAAPVSVPVVVMVILVLLVLIIIIYFQTVQCVRGQREVQIRSVPGGPYKVDAVAYSCDMA